MGRKRFSVAQRRPPGSVEDGWEPLEIEPVSGEDGSFRSAAAWKSGRPWLFGRLTTHQGFGAAVVLLAALAAVLNFTLPWAVFEVDLSAVGFEGEGTREVIDREEFRQNTLSYTKRMTDWPVAAFIASALAGLGLLGSRWILEAARKDIQEAVSALLLAVVAFSGFLLTLTGTRHLGDQNAYLIRNAQVDTVWVTYHLHAVPYVNLATGILLLAGGLVLARLALLRMLPPLPEDRLLGSLPVRATWLLVAAVGIGLLLMPLLPFALVEEPAPEGTEDFYLSERFMAGFDERGIVEEDVTGPLGQARLMLWVTLFISLTSCVFAVAGEVRRVPSRIGSLLHLQVLAGVPLVVGAVYLVLHYTGFGDSPLELFFNPLLPLTFLAVGAAYGHYLAQVFLPALKTAGRKRSASA